MIYTTADIINYVDNDTRNTSVNAFLIQPYEQKTIIKLVHVEYNVEDSWILSGCMN